jgi:hypothetical protein
LLCDLLVFSDASAMNMGKASKLVSFKHFKVCALAS